MKKDFKIIFDFFKNSELTENQIRTFQNELNLVYKDFNSLNLANSIFKLQLQLFRERKINKVEIVNSQTKNQKKEIKNKKINKERTIAFLLNQLYNVEAKSIFLRTLREIGIYKGKISYELTEDEYFFIRKDYLKLQLNNSDIPVKKRKTIKKKSTKNYYTNYESVYDKLRFSKSIGKFISIRTK
jgi:regulator of replication initiation timing